MGTRAGNQRSSIFLGNDGRYYGFVTMGIRPDGSVDRRKRTGKTHADVVRKVRALERERSERSALPAGHSPRLETWLTDWLAATAVRVRPSTLSGTPSTCTGTSTRLSAGTGWTASSPSTSSTCTPCCSPRA